MTTGSRAGFGRLVCSAIAFAWCGCLPDPRPYDPCGDNESLYYSVPPKGCNGHALETLHVHEGTGDTPTSPSGFYNFGLKERMALDGQHVYWTSAYGTILRTRTSDGKTDVLRKPSKVRSMLGTMMVPTLSIIGRDESNEYLYFGENLADVELGRNTVEIGAIELESNESRVLARFPDMVLGPAAVHHGQLYFASVDSGPLYSAQLDWSRVATSSDIAAAISDSVMTFSILDGNVYYLHASQPLLRIVSLDNWTTREVQLRNSPQASNASLESSAGAVYLFECDNSQFTGCQWTRIAPDGKRAIAASGLSSQGRFMAADAESIYVVSDQTGTMYVQPKLYGWNAPEATHPFVLAAPVETQRAIALDDDYVYLNIVWNDSSGDAEDGSHFAYSSRLLRVRR